MATNPIGAMPLTKADLAFVDAAIALQRQEQKRRQVPPGHPAAPIEALFGTIFIVAYFAYQAAVWVYHAVHGKLTLDIPAGDAVDGLLPSATLDRVVAMRNELAKAVGEPNVLK